MPMTPILYRGRRADLVFQKSFDTVTQRHHIRLWKAGAFEGRDVWIAAATHDTGIAFKIRSGTFTHNIDRNIDREREKVVTDLTFSGCAGTAEHLHGETYSQLYVSREAGLDSASGAMGATQIAASEKARRHGPQLDVTTDGGIAVMPILACHAQADDDPGPGPPGTKLTRLTRRVVLEARNYILRDNAYYWGFQIIKNRSLTKAISQ